MIGTTTALVLGGLAAAGQVGGAKIASNASKKAAGQQTAAADKAAGEIRAERDKFQTAYKPFADASTGAIRKLSDSIALRGAQRQPVGNPGNVVPMSQMMPGAQPRPQQPGWVPGQAMPLAQAVQRSQGQLWTVQAPDGETRHVSPEMGAAAIQRGATRVA